MRISSSAFGTSCLIVTTSRCHVLQVLEADLAVDVEATGNVRIVGSLTASAASSSLAHGVPMLRMLVVVQVLAKSKILT
jgi:hypothetical protein